LSARDAERAAGAGEAAALADGAEPLSAGAAPLALPAAAGPLRVKRLHPEAILPRRAHDGDAGLDLHAVEAVTLAPGTRASVGTGIAVAIPHGQAGLVLPRSGLALRSGIALVNAPGLIDAGYRGELRVLLLNTDRETPCEIAAGDRIAQLVLVRVELPDTVEVEALPGSQRGEGGFGSSGS
jgi:dUTP diphosphatase